MNARIFLRAAHGFFYRQTAVEMNQLNAILCLTRQRLGSCPLHANYLPGYGVSIRRGLGSGF